uniref:Secreted protein n=1 Tax=Ascaris lumbricoides TaxID=6252 RepID=A0A0M3I4S0_ASCLU
MNDGLPPRVKAAERVAFSRPLRVCLLLLLMTCGGLEWFALAKQPEEHSRVVPPQRGCLLLGKDCRRPFCCWIIRLILQLEHAFTLHIRLSDK